MICTGPSVELLLAGPRLLCQKWANFYAAFVLADQSESSEHVEQGSLKHLHLHIVSHLSLAAAARVFVATAFSKVW